MAANKSLHLSRLKNLRSQREAWSKPVARPIVEPVGAQTQQLEPELEALASWLDNVFHIPGIGLRFGLDSILGLIPGLGDTLTSVVSLYILHAAMRYNVPRVTLMRMGFNVGVDYLLGSVPLVGDLFDVFWKSNQWNVALLKQHVERGPQQRTKPTWGDWAFVTGMVAILLALLIGSMTVAFMLAQFMIGLVR